ncbi:MAG: hypothetical protein ACPGGA_04900 [Balneolaceae bacterium]
MNKVFILSVCLLFCTSGYSFAQEHETGVPYQMELINQQMVDQINDVPANIRRVAVYKLNYNPMRFTVQEVEYLRGEIEASFREYAGLTVLSPPELEPNDKMKIFGNDSTLQILNIQGRSLADVSPELLTEITSNYGVQGLIEVSLQRREPDGLILSLRMINPRSREIVWAKSFISNPFVAELEQDNGNTMVINFGVGSIEGETITRADTSFATPDTSINANVVVYSATVTYRQPLKLDNSAYIGFTGGLNLFRSNSNSSFDLTTIDLGITYYQAISEKNEDIDDFRMMLFFTGNARLPINSTKGDIYTFKPGVVFNLSKNIGLSLYSDLIISGETLTLENNDKITYSKVGYGLQAVIRF